MPIYAYKCSACGHAKDVLQKISDAPLSVCPECGQSTFSKQVTAAGFQLKGSGWYVTDFRGNDSAPAGAPDAKGQFPKGSAAPGLAAPRRPQPRGAVLDRRPRHPRHPRRRRHHQVAEARLQFGHHHLIEQGRAAIRLQPAIPALQQGRRRLRFGQQLVRQQFH